MLIANSVYASIETNTLWIVTESGNLYRIDAVTGTKVQSIDVTSVGGGWGIAVGPDGNVWFTSTDSITAVSADTNAIVKTISVGTNPRGIAIDSNLNAWVANYDSNTVSRVDLASGNITATIPVVINPVFVMVSKDQNVWVGGSIESKISKINPNTNQIDLNIAVSLPVVGMTLDNNNNMWVGHASSDITRVDVDTQTIISTISINANATNYMKIGPDGNIYVAHMWSPNNGVSIINPVTEAVTRRVYDGWQSNIAFSGNGKLWVTRRFSSNVTEQLNPQTLVQIGDTITLDAGQDAYSYGDSTGYVFDSVTSYVAPPTVSSDINSWQNFDANITLNCTSGDYPCNNIYYRLDTDSSNSISYDGWLTYDANIFVSTDGNYALDYNAVDTIGTYSSLYTEYVLIDKTAPNVSADYNSEWQNLDQNITLTCTDSFSQCSATYYRFDSDSSESVSYGDWTTFDSNIFFSSDGNFAVDFNALDNAGNYSDLNTIYVLIDKTAPEVSITSPTDGSSQTSTTITLVYSGSDANSGISNYWVSDDGNIWVNNNTNTSYSFTAQSVGSHTYYVRATDNADNNSLDSNITITVTQQENNGGTIGPYCGDNSCNGIETCSFCPADCGACISNNEEISSSSEQKQETLSEKEEILFFEKEYPSFFNESIGIITENDVDSEFNVKRIATEKEIKITRSMRIFALRNIESVLKGYLNKNTIFVENLTENKLEGIEIIEEIPKELLESASLISSDYDFIILKEDPLIKFNIDSLASGKKIEINYEFNTALKSSKKIEELFYALQPPAVMISLSEKDACLGVICNDYDLCTIDLCVEGKCEFNPKCTENHKCENGECIEIKKETTVPELKKEDNSLLTALIGLILIIILGYVLLRKK
ncbi:MAG: hypothetical protein JW703_00890 [Candidatus Diapherotrites archaeon]|nr:hypothetical protein [Candidatus Diapherotrites archaeon]